MNFDNMELKDKILEAFSGKVVRKDLAFLVKGNLPVPAYVLEYLLGQYCACDDENRHQPEEVRSDSAYARRLRCQIINV